MKSETAGPASAPSINHMLSFQGRLKSASHSDVRIKPLKINVSCPPPPPPLCPLSLRVSLSLSFSLTVTQSSGTNIDFVSLIYLFIFYYFIFESAFLCRALCIAVAAVTASAPGPRHGVIYSAAGVCSSDAPQTRRQQSAVVVLRSSGTAKENTLADFTLFRLFFFIQIQIEYRYSTIQIE